MRLSLRPRWGLSFFLLGLGLACSEAESGDGATGGAAGVMGGDSGSGASSGTGGAGNAGGGGGSDNSGGSSGSGASGGEGGSGAVSGSGGSGADGGSGGAGGSGADGGSGGASGSGGSGGCEPPTPSQDELDAMAQEISTNLIEPGDPGAADVTIEVSGAEGLRAISPHIYGVNGGADHEQNNFGLLRSGGNRLTAYNWENNASNAGSDYFFQNDDYLSESDEPAVAVLPLLDHCPGALLTVPIVDYVAADKNGDGDVRDSGPDYLTTRFKQNKAAKGGPLDPAPDPSDDFVYQDEFVNFVKNAGRAGPILFSLDNEPDLWADTHPEVHPEKVTYAELWERNQRFASAVKDTWPEAPVTGFVSYGFNGYVTLQDASDAADRDFIEWYLDQAKAAETSAGRRLIDYLDLHWYPEAQGGGVRITGSETDAAVVEARLQAPRSLWDTTYTETSWISDYLGAPIGLLPRLFRKIADHYPGTRLAFSEWSYGAGDHISGALAAADVLGIFGREGVALAAYWPIASDESFAYAGLRAYRNYDGSGGTFGNVSVAATTSDPVSVSVYASLHAEEPKRVVLVVINKAASAKTAALKIAHSTSFKTAATWALTESAAELVPGDAVSPVAENAFNVSLPAHSLLVVVPGE